MIEGKALFEYGNLTPSEARELPRLLAIAPPRVVKHQLDYEREAKVIRLRDAHRLTFKEIGGIYKVTASQAANYYKRGKRIRADGWLSPIERFLGPGRMAADAVKMLTILPQFSPTRRHYIYVQQQVAPIPNVTFNTGSHTQ